MDANFWIYLYFRFLFLLFGTLQNRSRRIACDQLFSRLLFHLLLFPVICQSSHACGCVTPYLCVWCGIPGRQKYSLTGYPDSIPHRNCGCFDIRKSPYEIWRAISSHGNLVQLPFRRPCWPIGLPGEGFWGRFVWQFSL